MEFCSLCGIPCIEKKHYRVVDIQENKAIGESLFCESCGLAYIHNAFNPTKKEPIEKVKPSFKIIKSPEELLGMMLGIIQKPVKKESPPCSKCGMTEDEFISKGRLGCAVCYTQHYETFIGNINVLQNGCKKHVGKKPKNFFKQEEASLDILKLRMVSAIEQERYEEAARIREKIRDLEENQ